MNVDFGVVGMLAMMAIGLFVVGVTCLVLLKRKKGMNTQAAGTNEGFLTQVEQAAGQGIARIEGAVSTTASHTATHGQDLDDAERFGARMMQRGWVDEATWQQFLSGIVMAMTHTKKPAAATGLVTNAPVTGAA